MSAAAATTAPISAAIAQDGWIGADGNQAPMRPRTANRNAWRTSGFHSRMAIMAASKRATSSRHGPPLRTIINNPPSGFERPLVARVS